MTQDETYERWRQARARVLGTIAPLDQIPTSVLSEGLRELDRLAHHGDVTAWAHATGIRAELRTRADREVAA